MRMTERPQNDHTQDKTGRWLADEVTTWVSDRDSEGCSAARRTGGAERPAQGAAMAGLPADQAVPATGSAAKDQQGQGTVDRDVPVVPSGMTGARPPDRGGPGDRRH